MFVGTVLVISFSYKFKCAHRNTFDRKSNLFSIDQIFGRAVNQRNGMLSAELVLLLVSGKEALLAGYLVTFTVMRKFLVATRYKNNLNTSAMHKNNHFKRVIIKRMLSC